MGTLDIGERHGWRRGGVRDEVPRSAVTPQVSDVELEPGSCGVEAEGHIRVVAGLVDGVVVHGEVVG
jgi:hypothetical protein